MQRGVSPSDIGTSFNDNVKMAPASASSIDGQTRTMVAYGVRIITLPSPNSRRNRQFSSDWTLSLAHIVLF